MLMEAQIRAEMDLAHGWPPFITDRDPPDEPRSYLCSIIDRDGAVYVKVDYWNRGWISNATGAWTTVLGWTHLPAPIRPPT